MSTVDTTAAGRTASHDGPEAPRRALDRRLAPRGPGLLGRKGKPDRPPQPDLLGASRAHRLLGLEPLVGAGAVPGPGLRLRPGRQVPAHRPADAGRCGASGSRTPSRSPSSAAGTGPSSAALLLLVPTILIAILLKPGVSYATLLIVAAFAGVGGGNFASSMTNINAFYPDRLKGWALGINAGGGNLGVPVVQLVGLLVLATLGAEHPRVLVAIYIPLIILAAVGAALFMDNLSQAATPRAPSGRSRGTARPGSCRCSTSARSGRSSGSASPSARCCWCSSPSSSRPRSRPPALTFLGPLLGSLIRPVGGALADRFEGSVVTFWNFIAMARRRRRSCCSPRS